MTINADLPEVMNIVSGVTAVVKDLAASATAGAWVSLKNYERCTVLIAKAAGVAGDDPTITLLQASAVAGTGSKALAISNGVYTKRHASALPATWTLEAASTSNTFTSTTLAEELALIAIPIRTEDLDVDNGFDCISVSIADVGSGGAQTAVILYLLDGPRYAPILTAESN